MKVVVVGHGMVGARLVEELCSRPDPDGAALDVLVLGGEDHDPYNRVLLSEVVAGVYDASSIMMPVVDDARVRVLRGTAAVAVDRTARVVTDSSGARHPYDALVLATGASARVPALEGLRLDDDEGGVAHGSPARCLVPGAHVLRTLDDARAITAACDRASRVVVLGGGVLGIEVAVGLAGRWPGSRSPAVVLVHPRGLMNAQLDAAAGEAATDAVTRLGVDVRTGVGAVRVTTHEGRLANVVLDDGTTLAADLLVLTVGAMPETALAKGAGLTVDRGVVVGPDLASVDDARVFAIGDCAQPPEGSTGLVAPGWEQARRLARALVAGGALVGGTSPGEVRPGETAASDRSRGGPRARAACEPAGCAASACDSSARPPSSAPCALCALRTEPHHVHPVDTSAVVKVKGRGVDIVAMGVSGSGRRPVCDAHPRRTVRLSDPDAGRHVEIVVQDGRVVGATCIGTGAVGADLVAAFTRGTPVPKDPAQLLLRTVGPLPQQSGAESPVRIPDRATICRCNGVTKGDLVRAWQDGDRTVDDVARSTRATTGCGTCADPVSAILTWLTTTTPDQPPTHPHPHAGRESVISARVSDSGITDSRETH